MYWLQEAQPESDLCDLSGGTLLLVDYCVCHHKLSKLDILFCSDNNQITSLSQLSWNELKKQPLTYGRKALQQTPNQAFL